ncbi:MAG: peptide ABC transporter substrate-binding protein [Chloroflexota bacterium]|nr:peptide ABC transporter substrate-binding protein [Chloroflexota bacterium]
MTLTRGLGRYAVTGAMMAALAVTALPKNSAAAPDQQGGTRQFPQTNQSVGGRFLEVWQGGRSDADALFINGFPITDKHDEQSLENGKIYPTQWFERARFEQHNENQKPYDVLLGRLGAFTAEGRKDVPFRGIDNPGGSSYYTKETRHTVGDSSEGGQAILKAWQGKGGLAQFGYPLSQPFTELTKETTGPAAGKSFLVQYFERQRFEYHPENKGTAFEVLLGRLGAEQKDQVATIDHAMTGRGNPVDTLNVGRGQDPSGLMPYSSNTLVGSNFLAAVFNGLTKRDDKDIAQPDLAYYLPTLENGGAYYVGTGDDKRLVVKYKLKQGVKWQDGQEFTSNDVVYTYKLVLDPDFPAVDRSGFEKYSSVDNPDKYTVIINYLTWKEAAALIARDKDTYSFLQAFVDSKIPVSDPLYSENFGFVLPEHFLSKTAAKDVPSLPWASTPWGTGPYYVTEFKANQSITMKINENYNVTANKPVIKTIFSPYDKDNKQLPVKIDTGAIDLTTSESFTPDLIAAGQASEAKGAKLYVLPYYGFDHIDFNTTKAPFDDVRVRQAVAYALDRTAINQALFGGTITLLNSPDIATNWASVDNPDNKTKFATLVNAVPKYNFDQAKAKALLDAAGWTVNAGTGIREKAGKPLKVTFLTTTKAYRIKLADIQQQQLKAVGIDSVGSPQPAATVFADPPDGPLYTGAFGDYGMVEFGWGGSTGGEPQTNQGLYGCASVPSDANNHSGQNDEFYCNPEFDKVDQQAGTLLGHTPERAQLYLQAQAILMKDLPTIPLFGIPTIFLAKKNLSFHGNPGGVLVDWQDWYLAK